MGPFFNYLVYGSADPISQDLKKIYIFYLKNFFFTFFNFFYFQLQVPSPDKGGGLASGAVRL